MSFYQLLRGIPFFSLKTPNILNSWQEEAAFILFINSSQDNTFSALYLQKELCLSPNQVTRQKLALCNH